MDIKLNNFIFLKKPYFSEKSNFLLKKNKTLVFRVVKNVNKIELLSTIEKLFKLKIKKIRTLWVKSKKKNKKNGFSGCTKKWKKVYVILKKNQDFQFNSLLK